jgi:hypothetical protein
MCSARDGPSSQASELNRKQNEILDTAQAILRLPQTLGNKGSIRYINLPFQMKKMIFRHTTLYSSEEKYDCFGATCCLYHQCKRHLNNCFLMYKIFIIKISTHQTSESETHELSSFIGSISHLHIFFSKHRLFRSRH